MNVARPLAVLCLCAALASGCGDDDDEAGTTAPAATTATAEATGLGGPGVTVGMKDFAFDPQEISITVGEEVTWRNDDSAEHNVVGRGVSDPPESENIGLGQTYTWRALRTGTVDYLCTIHPNMTGRILVEK